MEGNMRNRNSKDVSMISKTQMEQAIDEMEKKVENEEVVGKLEKAAEPLTDGLVSKETTSVHTCPDTYETPSDTTPVLGVVVGCEKLRVRKEPSTNGDVIAILPKKTVVKILEQVNGDWFKVQETKTIGYCMSKFIELQ
jgi:hypothetical protein